MKYLFLAVVVLIGGANAGGLLGLDNLLGLGDLLGCKDESYDVYFGIDTHSDIGWINYQTYIVEAAYQFAYKLKQKSYSSRFGCFFIGGSDYTSYPTVCDWTENVYDFKLKLLAASSSFTSHSVSPHECLYGGLKHVYTKNIFKKNYNRKQKFFLFVHDSPASRIYRRSIGTYDHDTRTCADSLKLEYNVEIITVPICTSCSSFSLDLNGLLDYVCAVRDQFGNFVRADVFRCTALGNLLSLVLNILTDLLCLVLGILG